MNFSKIRSTLLLVWVVSMSAAAQTYPTKTVQVVVPFAPGGPTDVLGRMVAKELSDKFGKTFIVDNKLGAAGNIGVDTVAKSAHDGHTLGIVPVGNIAVNPTLFPKLPYKAADLEPIAMLATMENVLVVSAELPIHSLKDLLALAAAKPDTLSFASPGAGSQAHLAGELLALTGKVQLVHVPYKGVGPALNDLLGGQVTMMVGQLPSVLPHIQSGKLRAIGLASLQRSAALPGVPTIAEQGMPGFEAVSWYALMTPTGTPKAVVERIYGDLMAMLEKPEVKEKFTSMGMQPGRSTPQQISAEIKKETARWAEVIKLKNIHAE